jgi:hypothetical protein
MAAGYCGASSRIKFDDEQFAALFNELQAAHKNKVERIALIKACPPKSREKLNFSASCAIIR